MICGSLSTAMEYEQEKRKEAIKLANSKNCDPDLCSKIWNEAVRIIAEESSDSSDRKKHVMSFVVANTSMKPKNYFLEFSIKKLIKLAISNCVTNKLPLSVDETINWGLSILIDILLNMDVKLSGSEIDVLKYLHEKNAYESPVNERRIYENLPHVSSADINHLYQLKCIDIDNEKVILKERILF